MCEIFIFCSNFFIQCNSDTTEKDADKWHETTRERCCRHAAAELPVLPMQRQETKRLARTFPWLLSRARLEHWVSPNLINTVHMSRQRCLTSRWPTSETVSPLLSALPLTPLVTGGGDSRRLWWFWSIRALSITTIKATFRDLSQSRVGDQLFYRHFNHRCASLSMNEVVIFIFWFCRNLTTNAYKCLSRSISHRYNMTFSCWIKLNQSQPRHHLFTLVALYFPISSRAHKRINNLLNLIITLRECLHWCMRAHRLVSDGFALQIKLITASRAIMSVACDSTN